MSDISKQTVKIMLILEAIALGIGVFFISKPLYYAFGIILGTALSAARFLLLEKALNKSVDMAPADAQNYIRLQYFLRMAVITVVAIIAAKVKYIDLLGFIIGLLPVAPAVHIQNLLSRKNG